MAISRREFVAITASACLSQTVPRQSHASTPSKFIFASGTPYDSIDPHKLFDVGRSGIKQNLYDGLYRYVDNPPKLIPWLATSHSVSDDGLTYIFNLREDAVFHDGRQVTANDVVYSIERILALKQGPSSLYRGSVTPGSTKARDPYTVVFNLNSPSAIFMPTVPDIAIVNSALVKEHEVEGDWGEKWLAGNAAGSGSFKLKSFVPATGWKATRNEKHFIAFNSNPIEDLEYRNVMETNTRVLGMIRGDFQGADGYMAQDHMARLRRSKNVQIIEQEAMRTFMLALNNAAPPLNDVHFRKALAYSFDYDGFIGGLMKGSVTRNPGPLPRLMWGSPSDIKGFNYDLDKAAAELKLVKEPLRKLTIQAISGYSESEQAAVLFQAALRKIGIESTVAILPWPMITKNLDRVETRPDVLPVWRSAFYLDPNSWLGEGFGTRYEGQRSIAYYRNPKFDKLLDRALVSNDQKERQTLYEAMTRMVTDDAASIFIYDTRWFGIFSSKVSGVRYSPANFGQDFRWLSIQT